MKLFTRKEGMEHFTLVFDFCTDEGQIWIKLEAWSIEQLEVNLIKAVYKYRLGKLGFVERFRALANKYKRGAA